MAEEVMMIRRGLKCLSSWLRTALPVAIAVMMTAPGSLGQSLLIAEHDKGVKQNPPGVVLTISTKDGRFRYHVSEQIHLRLTFTSTKLHFYTADLAPGGSAAVMSDEFVIQPRNGNFLFRIAKPWGIACCGDRRKYIGDKPLVGFGSFAFSEWRMNLLPLDGVPRNDPNPIKTLQPGEYDLFVQTRRVMRGWPKSEHDRYFSVSNILVTSGNTLHLTILPDEK
jgi:hypothetical protein